jgi:hypothetical protein
VVAEVGADLHAAYRQGQTPEVVLGAVGHLFLLVNPDGGVYGESSLYLVVSYGVYGLYGVGFVAAVLTAVRWGLKAAMRLRETVRAGLVLLPVSAALSLPLAVAIGRASDYGNAPLVVAAEFGLVLGLAGAALVAARVWALRPV